MRLTPPTRYVFLSSIVLARSHFTFSVCSAWSTAHITLPSGLPSWRGWRGGGRCRQGRLDSRNIQKAHRRISEALRQSVRGGGTRLYRRGDHAARHAQARLLARSKCRATKQLQNLYNIAL